MDSISENLPGWSFVDPAFLEELRRREGDGSNDCFGKPKLDVSRPFRREIGASEE
jgi:hypothetical protein